MVGRLVSLSDPANDAAGHAMTSRHAPRNPGRRLMLDGAGLTILAGAGSILGGAVPAQEAASKSAERVFVLLQPLEAASLNAATARLIPGDEALPGAEQANVTNFIDKALASGWGAGERAYPAGP
jgi:gluconate 2-dehydrogenase gamma chain